MGLWSWLKGKQPTRAPARPRPDGWSKTIDDLMAEKRTLSAEEIRWAREYERERLRSWARFPKDGEVFEAATDAQVAWLMHWQAPFTGGDRGTVRKGTRVRVSVSPQDPEPITVQALPLDGGELERQLVPEADRRSKRYGGFSLSIAVSELNRDFRLVDG